MLQNFQHARKNHKVNSFQRQVSSISGRSGSRSSSRSSIMDKKKLKEGLDFIYVPQEGWRCARCHYVVKRLRLDNLKSESIVNIQLV